MSTPTRERVTRCNVGTYLQYGKGWTLRVWREEPLNSITDYIPGHTQLESDVADVLSKFVSMTSRPLDIVRAVLALDRVNAVELVDMAGFGEKLTKQQFVKFSQTENHP